MKRELKMKFDFIKLLQIIFGKRWTAVILRLLLIALLIYRIDVFLYYWKGIIGVSIVVSFILFLLRVSDKKTQEMIDDTYESLSKRYEREYIGEKEGIKFKLSKATEYENKTLHIFNNNNHSISISGKILLFRVHYDKSEDDRLMKTIVHEKDFEICELRTGEGRELIMENAPRWVDFFRIEAEIVMNDSEIEIDCESKREFTVFDWTRLFELSDMSIKFLGYRLYWLKKHGNVRNFKAMLQFHWRRKTYGYPRFSKERVKDFFGRNLFRLFIVIITLIVFKVAYMVISDFVSFLRFIGGVLHDIISTRLN